MKHERWVIGHVSGWQEAKDRCVCGNPWPCPDQGRCPHGVLLSSNECGPCSAGQPNNPPQSVLEFDPAKLSTPELWQLANRMGQELVKRGELRRG